MKSLAALWAGVVYRATHSAVPYSLGSRLIPPSAPSTMQYHRTADRFSRNWSETQNMKMVAGRLPSCAKDHLLRNKYARHHPVGGHLAVHSVLVSLLLESGVLQTPPTDDPTDHIIVVEDGQPLALDCRAFPSSDGEKPFSQRRSYPVVVSSSNIRKHSQIYDVASSTKEIEWAAPCQFAQSGRPTDEDVERR